MPENNDRPHSKAALVESTAGDQALDLSAALASMGAFLGPLGAVAASVWGLIASGLSADRKYRRLVKVLEQTREELRALSEGRPDYVNLDYVNGEDFQGLIAVALQQAAYERGEEKRRFYARYIAGLAGAEEAPYEERRQELRTLDELQLRHLRVLRVLASGEGVTAEEQMAIDHGHSSWTRENMETLDQLNSMGLIHWDIESSQGRIVERRDRYSREVKTSLQGGRVWRKPHVTDYGEKLLQFILSPDESTSGGPSEEAPDGPPAG